MCLLSVMVRRYHVSVPLPALSSVNCNLYTPEHLWNTVLGPLTWISPVRSSISHSADVVARRYLLNDYWYILEDCIIYYGFVLTLFWQQYVFWAPACYRLALENLCYDQRHLVESDDSRENAQCMICDIGKEQVEINKWKKKWNV